MNPQRSTISISIEAVESSVQKLINSWIRMQKWEQFFSNPTSSSSRAAWRNNLTKFLESTPVHVVSLLLLFIDLTLTVLELSSSLISCRQKKAEVWYHWAGICILSLLSAKAMASAIGMGSFFFRRPGYVVDGSVAITALFLEAFLEKKGGGLVVILSLWRVVRVVESVFELSDEAIEAQIDGIICQFELLKDENRRLLDTIADKDIVIHKLQEIIEKLPTQPSECN